MRTHTDVLPFAAALLLAPALLAGDCEHGWMEGFGLNEIDGSVWALHVHDDGGGPALYAGGLFQTVGGEPFNRIARLGPSGWEPLGSGMNNSVFAMATFDGGTGPDLYVAGNFTTAGEVAAGKIARWDGTSWSALGTGLGGAPPFVEALAVFDDGSGPALYAGGHFESAGGVPAGNVARWDGAQWSAVGDGLNDVVLTLCVFDDGSGPALYAGGYFGVTAEGAPADYLAKWDGVSWSAVSGLDDYVLALAVYDDGSGSGPALYAGGYFENAGGAPASYIATWDGQAWSPLGSGVDGSVRALAVSVGGLYAGGYFGTAGGQPAPYIARWDGVAWSALGEGMESGVLTLAEFDDGGCDGPALYAGGFFAWAGEADTPRVARWNGDGWSAAGGGLTGSSINGYASAATAFATFDDGSGPAFVAAGNFTSIGGSPAGGVAGWDGECWHALGAGPGAPGLAVRALAEFDDGSGPVLVAAGYIEAAGGDPGSSHVAMWNGAGWSPLGTGLDYLGGRALAVFDDGDGPALYVAGSFSEAGGVIAPNIARWDGTAWSSLGECFEIGDEHVLALTVFDDGTGPALYAGGVFTSPCGVDAPGIARWDGGAWSAVGAGLGEDPGVAALAVFDDGSGPALHAGGSFLDGTEGLVRLDGSSWVPVGGGVDGTVQALAVLDDGAGPALFVGGSFETVGDGIEAVNVARWKGAEWSALDGGIHVEEGFFGPVVIALGGYAGGDLDGPALFAGGFFDSAGDVPSRGIARWAACPPAVAGDATGDGVVDTDDLLAVIGNWGPCPQPCPPSCPADLDGDCLVGIVDFLIVLGSWS